MIESKKILRTKKMPDVQTVLSSFQNSNIKKMQVYELKKNMYNDGVNKYFTKRYYEKSSVILWMQRYNEFRAKR